MLRMTRNYDRYKINGYAHVYGGSLLILGLSCHATDMTTGLLDGCPALTLPFHLECIYGILRESTEDSRFEFKHFVFTSKSFVPL